MDMRDWIAGLPGNPAPSQAAEKAQIDKSTISRQLKRGVISAGNVILLCRAYGKSPVDGLVETGYLRADELQGAGVPRALEQATNQQLLNEVMKRVDPEGRRLLHGGGITPITPRISAEADDDTDDVHELPTAARRVDDHPKPE